MTEGEGEGATTPWALFQSYDRCYGYANEHNDAPQVAQGLSLSNLMLSNNQAIWSRLESGYLIKLDDPLC